jgi:hypothetical protein
MRKRTHCILSLIFLVVGGVSFAEAQSLDISTGGAPTISGHVSGSVSGISDVTTDLSVTINFGEVSPLNPNNYVKVTVPIAIRSDRDYKVQATVTGGTNANVQALQRSDIGFGISNWRAMGGNSRICTNSPHIIYSPFSNDPTTTMSIAANGRVSFSSTLNNLSGATTLISGPPLSKGDKKRKLDDAWIFDAIFVIAPQFFANGNTTATITFTISDGFNVPC